MINGKQLMNKIKVTFDSNVWEKVVRGDENFINIRENISSGKIVPYICEIAISIESIKKKQRFSFWRDYKPRTEVIREEFEGNRFCGTVCFGPNNDEHPGLDQILKLRLLEAKSLGFKVITMTNIGTVRSLEIPDEMKISFSNIDDFWKYAEKLNECSKYINSLGAGSTLYHQFKDDYGLNGQSLRKIVSELPASLEKKFCKSVAEWVDGDSLSAHYAYQNDYFCTLDSGRSAGIKSVFSPDNLIKVTKRFNIKVISVCELAELAVSQTNSFSQ